MCWIYKIKEKEKYVKYQCHSIIVEYTDNNYVFDFIKE